MVRPAIWETEVAVTGGQVSAQEPKGQRNGYARFTLSMYIMQQSQGFSKRKNCSIKCNLIMVVIVRYCWLEPFMWFKRKVPPKLNQSKSNPQNPSIITENCSIWLLWKKHCLLKQIYEWLKRKWRMYFSAV